MILLASSFWNRNVKKKKKDYWEWENSLFCVNIHAYTLLISLTISISYNFSVKIFVYWVWNVLFQTSLFQLVFTDAQKNSKKTIWLILFSFFPKGKKENLMLTSNMSCLRLLIPEPLSLASHLLNAVQFFIC